MVNGRTRARTGRPGGRGRKPFSRLVALLAGILVVAALVAYSVPKSQARITGAGTVVRLYRVETQKTVPLPLEEYLIGAVAAQMPANYPLEALRAQAVAARSLAGYRLVPQGSSAIPVGADLSDDPREGQPWLSTREMESRWGWAYPFYYLKVADAVWSTRGEIATYGTQPVDAVNFGDSGGHGTENASDVWGVDVPYLRRVAPVAGGRSPAASTFSFDLPTLDKLLGTRLQADSVVRILSKAASGRPLVVQLGTDFLTAQYLANQLNLPSSYFNLQPDGDHLTITTTGSGNGVGMSRAGAALMAAHGTKWPDIIRHYYTGVEITRLSAL
ncbi:MAG TPA: SpoIID/LytB domain-containing protein [Spirochaetia bacterium]|nr:SpoIID/LytB domain-containing protein [Spirochaetia bacterium]